MHLNQKVFRLACECSGDGIMLANDAGRYVWVNQAAAEILGRTVEEFSRMSVADLSFIDAPPADELFSRFAEKKEIERGELVVRRPDESLRTISYSAGPLAPGLHCSIIRDITERHREREQLKRTLRALREAERIAHIGFWDWEPDTGRVWWSEGLYQICGRSVQEGHLPVDSWTDSVDERDVDRLLELIEQARRSGTYSAEFRLVRSDDGRLRRIRATGEFIPETAGRPARLIGAARDVTEERQTAEDLDRVLDLSPDLISVSDKSGRLLRTNPAYDNAVGWRRGRLTGRSVLDLTHADDRATVEQALWEAAAGEAAPAFRTRILTRQGSTLHVDWTFVGVPERREVYQFGRDVTALVNAESQLRRSEARYRDLVEDLPCAVWEVDSRNRFTYASPNHRALIGYDPQELVGRDAWTLLTPQQNERFRRLEADGGVLRRLGPSFEVDLLKKDGVAAPFEVRVTELRDESGAYRGIRGISQDVSERRRAQQLEEQLVRAQRLESLAVLAGGVAHDFNNLLTSIAGFAQLAADESPPDSPMSEYLDEVLRGCERAGDLVAQVLSFGRVENQAPRPTSFSEVVEEVANLLRPSIPKNVVLHLDLDRSADVVLADPTRLHQVVMNLCSNAVQAIGNQPGEIRVSVGSWDENDSEGSQELEPGSYVVLRVADDGPGIAPQALPHIFDPFFTTKGHGKGSGLGLSVAHGIIANAGGVLLARSELDNGAEFAAYLPRHQPDLAADPIFTESMAVNGPGDRILVVDDDPDILRLINEALRRAGYRVSSASDSDSARARLLDDPAFYRLLLVDFTMPGAGGIELLQLYREAGGRAPAILMSGYPERLRSADLTRLDVRGPLVKPFTLRALTLAVQEALAHSSATGTDADSSSTGAEPA